jgi:integrase
MLAEAVDRYLAVRRATGFLLEEAERHLRSFARFASDRGDVKIVSQTAIEWASLGSSQYVRYRRMRHLILFARYMTAEDPAHEVPPDGVFGHNKKRPTPFIYSQEQIIRLLDAARRLEPRGSLRPLAYSTLFGLLAATGLRISEALGLRLDDVTPDGLIIRDSKFHKSRLVPMHPTTAVALERYMAQRRRFAALDDYLFVSLRGRKRLSYWTVRDVFRTLRKTIGLGPGPRGRWPCMHQLRHTFAVRALEACPEGRDNVGRHMLALSTYLGHAEVADTYWYLEATPHLMRDIAGACETFLKGAGS